MIKFPAYVLSEEPEEIDGLLIIADQVVDDRNMSGETLGIRRLQSPMKSIYPLRYMVDDEIGMMKHRGKHFIDTNGVYWYNEKKKTAALIIACTASGSKSAGANDSDVDKMKQFGEYIGVKSAFHER